jgi:integrase
MRGSSKWQVKEVYKLSGIDRIGPPRHAAKEAAWAAGAKTSTEVAQKTGLHSFRTKEAYLKVWRKCLDHAKTTFRVGDIEKLTGEHVSSFLRSRIAEDVGRQTYGQAASALGKLENALRSYAEAKGSGLSYDFRATILQVSPEAKGLSSMVPGRAFRDPDRVISLLPHPDFRLAAAIQHDAGLRMSEATHVRPGQLKGEGTIEVRGKGGKIRVAELSRATYQQLAIRLEQSGEFRVSRDAYRSAVVRASEAADDKGSPHSFRHRWVQDRLQEKLSAGKTWERALAEVSREIGHERAEITRHYQGRR